MDNGDDSSQTQDGRVLAADVPYVRRWNEAERAAELLRRELRAWGIEGRTAVRADVTCAGVAVVELGWVTPEVAELLASLLAQARQQPSGRGTAHGRPTVAV